MALGLNKGDRVVFERTEDGVWSLRGMTLIPTDQAWFWTGSWQAGERAATSDMTAGRITTHESADEFLGSLDD